MNREVLCGIYMDGLVLGTLAQYLYTTFIAITNLFEVTKCITLMHTTKASSHIMNIMVCRLMHRVKVPKLTSEFKPPFTGINNDGKADFVII